jgi:hypothetical protein
MNWTGYVSGDPINMVDPSGYYKFVIDKGLKDNPEMEKLHSLFVKAQSHASGKIKNYLKENLSGIDLETRNAFNKIVDELNGDRIAIITNNLDDDHAGVYSNVNNKLYLNANHANNIKNNSLCTFSNMSEENVYKGLSRYFSSILVHESMHVYAYRHRSRNLKDILGALTASVLYENWFAITGTNPPNSLSSWTGKYDLDQRRDLAPDGFFKWDEIYTGYGAQRYYDTFINKQ